ncbi:MAG: Dabb family protein [Phycisphaerae bacterium]
MHDGLILTLTTAGLMFLLTGCSAGGGPARAGGGTGPGGFVHAVFFDLQPGAPEPRVEALIQDAYRLLGQIPTVRTIDSGRRETLMRREVNDQSFTVGLVVYFDDKAGHDVYATHPLHQEYIDKHKDLWARVRVMDFNAEGS